MRRIVARAVMGLEMLHAWKRVEALSLRVEMQWVVMVLWSRTAMEVEGVPREARTAAAGGYEGFWDAMRVSRAL
jgi:hypothetical protein